MATPSQNISVQLNQSPVKSAGLTGLANPTSPVSLMSAASGSFSPNSIRLPTVSPVSSLGTVAQPSLVAPASPTAQTLAQIPGFSATTPLVSAPATPIVGSAVGTTPQTLMSSAGSPTLRSGDVSTMLSQMTPVPMPSPSPSRVSAAVPSAASIPSAGIPTIRTAPAAAGSPVSLPVVPSSMLSGSVLPSVRSLPMASVGPSAVGLPTVTPIPNSIRLPTVTPEIEASGIGLATKSSSYGSASSNPVFSTPSQLATEKKILATSSVVGSPVSGLKFSTMSGVVPDQSVEDQLAIRGYITTDRVLTKSPSGEVEGRYLKTINERGQIVYVEPDTEGYVSVQPEDRTMIESKSASKVPMSARTGTFECAGMDVCGVAFECEGELCTLTREDASMAPSELVLHTVGKPAERSVVEEGTPIAFPIVRLSEILVAPEQVVESIDTATVRIRNASYQSCVADMNRINRSLDSASGNFKTLVGTLDGTFKKLGASVNELEALRAGYDAVPPQNDEQREKIRKITFNLHRRHDMLTDLLRLCKTVSAYGEHVNEISDKFSDFTDHIEEAYKGIDFVYEE